MKSYNEMAQSALERGHLAIERKNKKRKLLIGTASAVMSLVIIAGAVVFIFRDDIFDSNMIEPPIIYPNDHPNIDSPDAIMTLYGKTVNYSLYEKLQSSKDDDIIEVSFYHALDPQFVYNGKTIGQYQKERDEESNLPGLLEELLKDGDYLKYGEKLYTTGTPDGERWAKELYEKRIEYYGQELLDKYIANGEFLADKLRADIDALINSESRPAYEAYAEAYKYFMTQSAMQAKDELEKHGYKASVSGNHVVFKITKKDFEMLDFEGIESCHFDLALKSTDHKNEPLDRPCDE